MKKALLIILGTFVLAAFLSLGIWALVFRDELPASDGDLYLQFQPAPRENNGYMVLAEIGEKADLDKGEIEKMLNEKVIDIEKARAMITVHRSLLDTLYKVTNMPNFGRVDMDGDYRLNSALIKLALLEGRLALNEGDRDRAAKIGVYLVELGYKYEHCNGALIDGYLGMIIKKQGLELIDEALGQGLSDSMAEDIRRRLRRSADSRQGYIALLRLEYSVWGHLIANPEELIKKSMANEKSGISYGILRLFYKPHETQRIYAGYFRDLIAYQEGKLSKAPCPMEDRIQWSLGNYMGTVLLNIMTPSLITDQPKELETKLAKTLQAIDKLLNK